MLDIIKSPPVGRKIKHRYPITGLGLSRDAPLSALDSARLIGSRAYMRLKPLFKMEDFKMYTVVYERNGKRGEVTLPHTQIADWVIYNQPVKIIAVRPA